MAVSSRWRRCWRCGRAEAQMSKIAALRDLLVALLQERRAAPADRTAIAGVSHVDVFDH